eukprot:801088_1
MEYWTVINNFGDVSAAQGQINFVIHDTDDTMTPPSTLTNKPTPKPVSSPVESPSAPTSNENIFVRNFGNSLGVWWYVALLTGVQSGYDVERFEVQSKGSNEWDECAAVYSYSTEYQCQAKESQYVFPLSVRLTATDGEVITSWYLITEYTGDVVFDFGDNFGGRLLYDEESTVPTTASLR